jgi:hypothetical protein
MDEFIKLVSSHSAKCGHEVTLIHRCTNYGAYVREVWKCSVCHEELELTNSEKVKTEVVEQERRYSKIQADINLRISGAFTAGVNMTKTINFISKVLGIKMSNKKNLHIRIRNTELLLRRLQKKGNEITNVSMYN